MWKCFALGCLSMSTLGAAKAPELSQIEILKRSLSDDTGDIFLVPMPYNFLVEDSNLDPKNFYPSQVTTKKDGKDVTEVLPPHPLSTHSALWDYDLKIPIAFYDKKNIWTKPGRYPNLTVQQDIAPTLAAILDMAPPSKSEGQSLHHGIKPQKQRKPKIILTVVQDQMGWQYYRAHPNRTPFINSIFTNSALFTNAQVAHVDVETAVGHAAIGTGGYARAHKVTGNAAWQSGIWHANPVFTAKLTEQITSDAYPLLLGAATLADEWVKVSSGEANVLVLTSAQRASLALGGHGSMYNGGKKTHVLFLKDKEAPLEYGTNENFYSMPESIKGLSARPYADEFQKSPTPSWKKHVLITKEGTPNVSLIRASPALVRFELDILLKSIAELKLGEGNTTDLLFVNFKSSDYCGHLLGFESDECGDVVAEIDNALKTVITHLEKVTQHELLTVLTADHGASPLPELTGGVRLSRGKLHRQLNERFKATPSHFDVVPFMTNSQIWLHKGELKRAGYRVTDVIKFLKTYEAELKHPENTRADYWLKHGKKAKSPFFHSVVSRDELKS